MLTDYEAEVDPTVFHQREATVALREEIEFDLLVDALDAFEVCLQRIEPRPTAARGTFTPTNHQAGVPAGSIDDDRRFEADPGALFERQCLDLARPAVIEHTSVHGNALQAHGSSLPRAVKKYLIKASTAQAHRPLGIVRHFGDVRLNRLSAGNHQVHAGNLLRAGCEHPFHYAQSLERRKTFRRDELAAQLSPGHAFLLQQQHSRAALGKRNRSRRTSRPTPDYDCVVIRHKDYGLPASATIDSRY